MEYQINKIGKYQIVRGPSHDGRLKLLNSENSSRISEIEYRLWNLAKIFEGARCFISGSLAIPLILAQYDEQTVKSMVPHEKIRHLIRRFYRMVDNTDLAVLDQDLEKLILSAEKENYRLFHRSIMAKMIGKRNVKGDLYEPVSYESLQRPYDIKKHKYKNLRLIQTNEKGDILPPRSIISFIDVYIHHLENSNNERIIANRENLKNLLGKEAKKEEVNVISHEEGINVPANHFFGHTHDYKDGLAIEVVNPAYLYHLKARHLSHIVNDADLLDMSILFNILKSKGIEIKHEDLRRSQQL